MNKVLIAKIKSEPSCICVENKKFWNVVSFYVDKPLSKLSLGSFDEVEIFDTEKIQDFNNSVTYKKYKFKNAVINNSDDLDSNLYLLSYSDVECLKLRFGELTLEEVNWLTQNGYYYFDGTSVVEKVDNNNEWKSRSLDEKFFNDDGKFLLGNKTIKDMIKKESNE